MKLKKWEIALIVALAVTALSGAALSGEQGELSERLIRLHVVANSDSEADQALKMQVRDRVLSTVGKIVEGAADRDEAARRLEVRIGEIEAEARKAVRDAGYSYPVSAGVVEEDYPTCAYGTFSLPAGRYTSLRVVIGAGAGHNWWCVIFPPLCLSVAIDREELKKLLTEDQIRLITSDEPECVVKFKAMEIFEKLRRLLGI